MSGNFEALPQLRSPVHFMLLAYERGLTLIPQLAVDSPSRCSVRDTECWIIANTRKPCACVKLLSSLRASQMMILRASANSTPVYNIFGVTWVPNKEPTWLSVM
ncbi:hypothetical protein J3458_020291 [Metarhizium acridum]|uniref:uncharacterized protein n=1 Tax=Metarhizium acridum TaxID=92637 RepID=UPI001C6B70BA|nr:hypothetical protein J3458_020291 [Metarhizium acridum]